MTTALTRTDSFDLQGVAVPASPPEVPDDPSREIRFGGAVAILFFVIFLGWAAFARLDAAAQAPGRLVVTGQRQTVQHREGGVVSQILVKEGARVQRGQVLIRLAGADVKAQERSLSFQAIGLLAQRARLHAEQAGRNVIAAPAEFAEFPVEYQPAVNEALQIQRAQLRTRAAVLSAQRGALGQRTVQANSQGQGYSRQMVAIDEQLRLINDELSGMREAADKGFVSKNRIRALERAKADLEGQRGQYAATIAQSRGQASETRLQVLEAESNHLERVAQELREVEASLSDVLPRLNAARDQLSRSEIRAPVAGTIVGLTVFTPGGVIEAGQKLMDIVPDKAPLTIEARVSAADGDDVQVGQDAFIRFETLHDRNLPILRGKVTRVSADAFTDEKTGTSFYTADIAVPVTELKLVESEHGEQLRAGLPVGIQIPLRKRTALEYAFEPLMSSIRRSFHEH
jgi:HlyD family secretion protein